MPLRLRLSITLVAIVLVPLTVTAFIVMLMVDRQQDARSGERLSYTAARVNAVLAQYARRAETSAADLVHSGLTNAINSKQLAAIQATTRKFATDGSIDFVAVTRADGVILTIAHDPDHAPHFAPGVTPPSEAERIKKAALARTAHVDDYAVYGSVGITSNGRFLGSVVAGFWLDNQMLDELGIRDATLAFVAGDRVTAASPNVDIDFASLAAVQDNNRPQPLGEKVASAARVLDDGPVLVVTRERATGIEAQGALSGLLAVLAVSVVLAGLLGWLTARVTTKPLADLSEAALEVASGKFETRFEVRSSKDEVGRLALAFNTMTQELRTYIKALQDSRDELKRNLTRLGETLSSTHDLRKMLAVILETAMVTSRAEAGSLMLMSANRDELYLKVGRGLEGRLAGLSTRLRVGDGVAGKVAETGESLHGLAGEGGALRLSPNEPRARDVISVPLKSQGRVIGVLNLYDRADGEPFDDNEIATIRSFAHQATVAIDNVLLHQEAQRLSITDGLTGLWNYRYFQMNFDKEIERATRFARPLALLILDLDKFKSVNDALGHQRGDAVLIELAARVKGAIREVDTLARYGGEEFVLILPETDLDGAVQAAAKICETVRQRRFGNTNEEPIRVTVSIGVAVFPRHGRTVSELVKAADAALYAAKESGRDRYAVSANEIDFDAPIEPIGEGVALDPPRDLGEWADSDFGADLAAAPSASAIVDGSLLGAGDDEEADLGVGSSDVPVADADADVADVAGAAEPAPVPQAAVVTTSVAPNGGTARPSAIMPAVVTQGSPVAAEPPAEAAASEPPAEPAADAAPADTPTPVTASVTASGAGRAAAADTRSRHYPARAQRRRDSGGSGGKGKAARRRRSR